MQIMVINVPPLFMVIKQEQQQVMHIVMRMLPLIIIEYMQPLLLLDMGMQIIYIQEEMMR